MIVSSSTGKPIVDNKIQEIVFKYLFWWGTDSVTSTATPSKFYLLKVFINRTTPSILAYWASGPLTNLDPSVLSSGGWTRCYNGTYAVNLIPSQIATILSQCNQTKLLLACKPLSNSNYTLAAMGLRSDVLYNCSSITTCTHVANGVGWYFSDTASWGFVSANDSVTRTSCDTASTNPTFRLCWHTGFTFGGYRCGSTTGLNSDTTWERSVWQANWMIQIIRLNHCKM